MVRLGLDIGSKTIKLVLVDDDAQTVYIKSRNAPQTGDRGILLAWITFTTLSGLLLLVLILKRHLSRGDIDL